VCRIQAYLGYNKAKIFSGLDTCQLPQLTTVIINKLEAGAKLLPLGYSTRGLAPFDIGYRASATDAESPSPTQR